MRWIKQLALSWLFLGFGMGIWNTTAEDSLDAAVKAAEANAASHESAPATLAHTNAPKILLLCGRNNHDWLDTTPVLKQLLEEDGRFIVDVTKNPSKMNDAMLTNYDAILSNWSAWPDVTNHFWGTNAEKAFVKFVASGKGFVLFHAASATFHTWPEYQDMACATWDTASTGHGSINEFKVNITETNHPITSGMSDFWIRDELWHRMQISQNAFILAKAFSSPGKGGSNQNEPVALITRFGKGRCFNLVLGHDSSVMTNAAWRTLMKRGVEWAAKGKVTVPIPKDWPKDPHPVK